MFGPAGQEMVNAPAKSLTASASAFLYPARQPRFDPNGVPDCGLCLIFAATIGRASSTGGWKTLGAGAGDGRFGHARLAELVNGVGFQ